MKYWTVDELRKLFAACEGWVRDFAILDANSGLRVSALSGLTWADIDFAGGRIVIPTHLSKSGKSYSVPFTPTAQEVLARRWLEDKSKAPSALIFSGESTGKKIDRGQIWRRLKAAVKRAGIRDFGHYSHALRHSFAVALVGADIKIRVIQDFLGHSSLKTTEIYAKVSPDKAKAEMERFDISAAPVNPPPALDPTPGDPKAHPPAPDSGT
jgi:integrase